jgi:hypothetical protein
MKFAQEYKYRNIPFCSQCAAHTKFIPVQSNRVVGAVTYDNPNSNIDPTFVATRTETKLVCSTCGSEMFKWADKGSATSGYFQRFLTASEAKEQSRNDGCGCLFLALWPLGCAGAIISEIFKNGGRDIGRTIYIDHDDAAFLLSLALLIGSIVIFILLVVGSGIFDKKKKMKKFIVGKGVNGETVWFDQETGKIEYK